MTHKELKKELFRDSKRLMFIYYWSKLLKYLNL